MHFSSSLSLLFPIFFIFVSHSLSAQDREFGDVAIADFYKYDTSYDSTSPAIALFDVAKVYFDAQYNVVMERHTRLKILNESGLKYGDVEIVFDREINQDIDGVKAVTYTVDQGVLNKTEISGKDVFEERLVEQVYAKKFSMPNIKKGAILEYTYQKTMGNPFFMPDWAFHKEIPVQHSSIYMRIPWRFNYHMVFKGTDSLYTTNSGNFSRGTESGYFLEISKDSLPPVENLSFINSRDNFISKVYTQLNYAYRDDRSKIEYLKDWEQISDEIRKHPDIGKQKTNRAIRKKVEELTAGASSEQQKVEKIFEFVSTSIVWNGYHRVISEKGIRDTFDDKSGSSGDVNLLLYKMLEEAGIKVSYGLSSTRSHGAVLPDYPIVNQFNNLITLVEVNGQIAFLDATEGNRSLRLPPVKNLYQLAYVVQDDNYGWVEIKPFQTSASKDVFNYSIDEAGKATASLTHTSAGYIAESRRKHLNGADINKATESVLEGLENLTVDSVIVRGMDVSDNTAVHYTEFTFDIFGGDSLKPVNYLNPMLFLADAENLLERPTREFPVYFPYPFQESKQVNITLPKGYVVDEVPESGMVVLPENKGMLNFQVQSTDSTVSITSDFSLNKMFFKTEEYQSLREMFLKLSETHSGAVVIKRL